MRVLDSLFPDDPAARDRRYAAESVTQLEAAMANGDCDADPGYWHEQLSIMRLRRETV